MSDIGQGARRRCAASSLSWPSTRSITGIRLTRSTMTRARQLPARPVRLPRNMATPPAAPSCFQVSAVTAKAIQAPKPSQVTTIATSARDRRGAGPGRDPAGRRREPSRFAVCIGSKVSEVMSLLTIRRRNARRAQQQVKIRPGPPYRRIPPVKLLLARDGTAATTRRPDRDRLWKAN